MFTIATTTKKKKVNTLCLCNTYDTCPFYLQIVFHKSNDKCYIKSLIDKYNDVKVGVYNSLQNKIDAYLTN